MRYEAENFSTWVAFLFVLWLRGDYVGVAVIKANNQSIYVRGIFSGGLSFV